jgi:hypothetical protein
MFIIIFGKKKMGTKTCRTCKAKKPKTEFHKTSFQNNKDGLNCNCKECHRIKRQAYNERSGYAAYKKYEKTHQGFLMRLYRNMQSRVTGVHQGKAHLYEGKYLLPREEFYNWALNSDQFFSLFKAYEESGFLRKLAPSVDRINSLLGYSIENMEWVTHSENSRRGSVSPRRKKDFADC